MTLAAETGAPIALDGTRKPRGSLTRARIRWVIAVLVLVFAVVIGRLAYLGSVVTDDTIEGRHATRSRRRDRPFLIEMD